MDPANLTGAVLEQLAAAGLPADAEIEVILGSGFSDAESQQANWKSADQNQR